MYVTVVMRHFTLFFGMYCIKRFFWFFEKPVKKELLWGDEFGGGMEANLSIWHVWKKEKRWLLANKLCSEPCQTSGRVKEELCTLWGRKVKIKELF